MFTGLIESTGEVVSFSRGAGAARLTIAVPESGADGIVARLRSGDSIAVSGVCLTALAIDAGASPQHFSADLAEETIARTTLSRLAAGSMVNLELPTPAGAPLGGHVVQGHVDGTATLLAFDAQAPGAADSDWVMKLKLPPALSRYVVEKGSIAVEGISLTVARLKEDEVTIAIIPHTYAFTSLHTLTAGMELNIEVDVMAKYADQRARRDMPTSELTVAYLIANGY